MLFTMQVIPNIPNISLPLYNQVQTSDDWLQSNCFAPVIKQDLFYQLHDANHILTVQGYNMKHLEITTVKNWHCQHQLREKNLISLSYAIRKISIFHLFAQC